MGRLAIHPSATLADLMRERRRQMGLSLRDVQRQSEKAGTPIPYATLAKVEQGRVDPGVRRLYALLRLYNLPIQLAADLLDIEELAGELPPRTVPFERLLKDGIDHWSHGRIREGMACLLAMRQRQPTEDASKEERHKALLSFSIAAAQLGKVRVAHQIIENLLLDDPSPDILVNILVHGATCWYQLGAPEAALGFLAQAETHLGENDHEKRAWVLAGRGKVFLSSERLDDAENALIGAEQAYAAARNEFGRCQVVGSRIRVAWERGDFETALELAIRGRELARAGEFERLHTLRVIDEGRSRFALGDRERGTTILQEALGAGLAKNDHILAFQAHHALWKAFEEMGDARRAELELKSAEYYSRFADYTSAEVREVRDATRRKTKPAGAKRRAG